MFVSVFRTILKGYFDPRNSTACRPVLQIEKAFETAVIFCVARLKDIWSYGTCYEARYRVHNENTRSTNTNPISGVNWY